MRDNEVNHLTCVPAAATLHEEETKKELLRNLEIQCTKNNSPLAALPPKPPPNPPGKPPPWLNDCDEAAEKVIKSYR